MTEIDTGKRTQIQSDIDDPQRLWAGMRRTLDAIQRGCAAIEESKDVLRKLAQQL